MKAPKENQSLLRESAVKPPFRSAKGIFFLFLQRTIDSLAVFLIIVGLYSGVFTPTEVGAIPDVPRQTIFKGVMPFLLMEDGALTLFIVFPEIITFVPSLMKH